MTSDDNNNQTLRQILEAIQHTNTLIDGNFDLYSLRNELEQTNSELSGINSKLGQLLQFLIKQKDDWK